MPHNVKNKDWQFIAVQQDNNPRIISMHTNNDPIVENNRM